MRVYKIQRRFTKVITTVFRADFLSKWRKIERSSKVGVSARVSGGATAKALRQPQGGILMRRKMLAIAALSVLGAAAMTSGAVARVLPPL
jgi:hypothetical protein